jgi:leucyl aminopeptidase (aminopeptidase T)
MIVDGIHGDFFNQKYGNLEDTPISVQITNSRADVGKISCENKELLMEIKQYLSQDDNANTVGEFACGTNVYLKDFVGNLLQDEKFPGGHIAFGNPFPPLTGADWKSIGHVDGIMKECSLWFDDKIVIENGKYKGEELLTFDSNFTVSSIYNQ